MLKSQGDAAWVPRWNSSECTSQCCLGPTETALAPHYPPPPRNCWNRINPPPEGINMLLSFLSSRTKTENLDKWTCWKLTTRTVDSTSTCTSTMRVVGRTVAGTDHDPLHPKAKRDWNDVPSTFPSPWRWGLKWLALSLKAAPCPLFPASTWSADRLNTWMPRHPAADTINVEPHCFF